MINITCQYCENTFQTNDSNRKFCCRHCSAMYNGYHSKNRKMTDSAIANIKNGLSNSDKWKNYLTSNNYTDHIANAPVCRICGEKKNLCPKPDICKFLKTNTLTKILVKFGFDLTKLGSIDSYNELFKIQKLLYNLYEIDKLSLVEISESYNISSASALLNTFKFLKIPIRNSKESVKNSIISGRFVPIFNGKLPHNNRFKHGWHNTWDNHQVYYRSSYELEYAKYLDNLKIQYKMENLQIPYFHEIENKMRISVPDFYIPSLNMIIEIKSDFTYCRRDMISRFKSYKQNGYNYKLILENKDYGKRLPKTKNTFYDYIRSYNKNLEPLYRNNDI